MIGSLQNARVGVALHAQAGAQAGGMTYRPQGGVEQRPARLSHKQEVAGSTPAPAPPSTSEDSGTVTPTVPESIPVCGFPKAKTGLPCQSEQVTDTGFCFNHNPKVAEALGALLGA